MATSLFEEINQEQKRRFHKHLGIFSWFLFLSFAGLILFLPFDRSEKIHLTILLVVSILYSTILYFGLIPSLDKKPFLFNLTVGFSTLLIGWAHYILGPYHLHVDKLYAVNIICISVLGSWKSVVPITFLSIGVNYFVTTNLVDFRSTQYIIIQAVDAMSLSIVGLVSGLLGRTLHHFNRVTSRKNRSLSMLVEANRITNANQNLNVLLPELARTIAQGLPATSCRIALLDPSKKNLIDYGMHPLRNLSEMDPYLEEKCSLDHLPFHKKAIDKHSTVFVNLEEKQGALSDKERDILFFKNVKTICIVPIQKGGDVMGLLSIGEARSWNREPFPPQKLELLTSLANQTASTIHTTQLRQDLENQANRLAVVYDVGKVISKTIEIDDLLELIYEQLMRVIPSDAYFVALYLPGENVLNLRMLIDNGKHYPARKVPADQGLSSWVIENQESLLIKDLAKEASSLPIEPVVVGEDKITPSWLGVPMITESEVIGILAVACYQAYAYNENDQYLLEQIAQQAALSIKNARHHMEVERQASLDSLTGVLNHGHFIETLHRASQIAKREKNPLSLIMLDIDHFKEYNDTYGHVVGDQVLKLTVEAIEKHVKNTDSVGRWGGEEFGIALPGANIQQAELVAKRIRKTLARLPLYDSQGNPIPKPTVSQGIATLPGHSKDIDELIKIADRALYRAKGKGRDQYRIAETPSP